MAILTAFTWAPAAWAQPSAPAAARNNPPPVTWFARNLTRIEVWRFFEPPPTGGDPEYAFIANRLQAGLQRSRPKYDVTLAFQYVQFGGLPARAVGPGPLGTGALYYMHSGRSDSHQVYVRYADVRLKNLLPGVTVQVGRVPYASGAEAPSGNPKIEAVKRQRVDSRLIGEFEWSHYQRGFDGVRVDVDRPGWRLTSAAFRPTQGGFEDAAGAQIKDLDVLALTVNVRPGRLLPRTDIQAFAYRYDDERPVAARPDNTGRPARAVDVGINSFGATLVGAYPTPAGEFDAMAWIVGQTGSWYGQTHRAFAIAGEAGHQWTRAPWRPWVRAGFARASGDPDGADDRHGTFFQMLPTGRKYSYSTTYSLMNLTDVFGEVLLRPHASVSARLDVRRISLAERADRWYSGSGATQQSGTIFGYAGRPSFGATDLGTVVEGSIDVTWGRHWSLAGYVGRIWGGRVVRGAFADDRLTFAYLEQLLRF